MTPAVYANSVSNPLPAAALSAIIPHATLCCQHDRISKLGEPSRYDFNPTVITTHFSRRKPSTIEACITFVMFLENATSGEFAILRIALENAGSERTRLHSAGNEVSRPDTRVSAFSATAGKGGSCSGLQAGVTRLNALDGELAIAVAYHAIGPFPIFN
jgi:hypothetical protein